MDSMGRTAELTFTVTDADTAQALGSGDLPVLATPRLLAWLEAATCAAVTDLLPQGSTSVGTRVDIEHTVASPLGATVRVNATILGDVAPSAIFTVTAEHEDGTVVAHGTVGRVVVDTDRFLAGLAH